MKLLMLTVSVALTVTTAFAAKPAAKKPAKSVTLKRLIEVSIAKGETWTLDDARTSSLGYTKAPSTKEFVVAEISTYTQLTTMVTYADDGKTTMDLIFSSTTITEMTNEQPTAIDGYSFRADLSGRLISGIRAYGKVGDVLHDKLDVTSAATKKQFGALTKALLVQPVLTPGKK